MSLFNRKTFLDGGFQSLSTHGISLGDVVAPFSGGIGDVLGDITGSTAAAEAATAGARSAAEATMASTRENIEFQKWLWGEQKALAEPYSAMGAGAIPQYQEMLGQPIDPTQDPGYQFGLTQGQQAVSSSGAARGMQLSGAQQKAQQRFGTDYASTKYNEAFNRRQANLDNLYRMISSGQAAAAGQAATGGQMGAQVGSSILAGGQAQSQMYSDIGNIQAGQAMAPWNTLMDVGSLAASAYGG
jgi:hypothetical protein